MLGNMRKRLEFVRPPRALWVRAKNGEMVGTAGDPAAQIAMLQQTFRLLARARGDEGWVIAAAE